VVPLTSAQAFELTKLHFASWYGGIRERNVFQDVETYCMFVGYPRSGHSILGALLDGHPDVLIANELDTLKYVQAGFRKRQIYYLLLRQSRATARRRAGNPAAGVPPRPGSYAVAGQWQGRLRRLRVIGDKKGGGSSMRLGNHPNLLDRLRRTIDVPIKFVHVVRNPYDNISTMAKANSLSLEDSAARYVFMCESVVGLRERVTPADWCEIRQEEFIAQPAAVVTQLCDFVGVDAPRDNVEACAGIVYSSPHKSRFEAGWTPSLVRQVGERLARIDFLHDYAFDA
jgi:hypothetical protein